MSQTKKMNESSFAQLVKELNALGELIRARQDEKQAIIDEFGKEKERFRLGRIPEKTLASSALKTNAELKRLDAEIRSIIRKVNSQAGKVKSFCAAQSPKSLSANVKGVHSAGSKKKPRKKPKKPVKHRKAKKKK